MKPKDVAKMGSRKAFLVKSLAQRFQDEAQDVAKIGSAFKKALFHFFREIFSLEISR